VPAGDRPGRGDHHHGRPEATLIPKIHPRGTNVGRLLYYLFGPGKCEEHTNPHLVAAWNTAPPLHQLQPPRDAAGRHDLRRLTDLLEQPVRAGIRPPQKTVWHASIRNHPTDPILSDQQWAHIASELMAAVGLAPHGDRQAVRWLAVRHADDHIHLVATLVRQDGRTAWGWNERRLAQAACRHLEARYGLYRVGPVDHTSHRYPEPAELNKAARFGQQEVPRTRLRREVRAAAAAATGEADFFHHLRTAGLLVKLRESTINPGQTTGYAVGLPGHHTAAGTTIWYSGGRLAPDLTLPKLRHRWSTTDPNPPPAARTARARPNPDQRAATLRQAADTARRAATDLRHLTATGNHAAACAVTQAAADLLTTTARSAEGRRGGPITNAAEAFDRAARQPNGRPPPRHHRADQLRTMARLVAVMGRLTTDNDTTAALWLVYHLAALADHLADLRQTQERLHQARDARHVAEQLRSSSQAQPARGTVQAPSPGQVGSPTAPAPATRNQGQGR
jgi:hypothetical protein